VAKGDRTNYQRGEVETLLFVFGLLYVLATFVIVAIAFKINMPALIAGGLGTLMFSGFLFGAAKALRLLGRIAAAAEGSRDEIESLRGEINTIRTAVLQIRTKYDLPLNVRPVQPSKTAQNS
jgi:hypothetical protein